MIHPGDVNSLYQYAKGNHARIAKIVARRDAIMESILDSQASSLGEISSATTNGKTYSKQIDKTTSDLLNWYTATLEKLGYHDPEPTVVFADFREMVR